MRKIRVLLACCVVAASVAGMAAAVPAFATNETYPHPGTLEGCGKCEQVSGPNNYIRNNESINYSGEGFCDTGYLYSGGFYYKAFEECYSSGKGIVLCYKPGEFYGHGQTRRYYAKYEYNLWGRQDNYAACS